MPIYEYRCEACGHEMDALQKLSDAPLVDCPACGRPGLKKLISAAGFRLKGSGWYETDFKKGGQQRNLHEAGGKGESKGSDGGKGESKGSDGGKGESKGSDGGKGESKSTPAADSTPKPAVQSKAS